MQCLAFAVAAASSAGCAADSEVGALGARSSRATAGEYDLADYILPSCDGPSATWQQSDGQRRRVIPMGVQNGQGRFIVVKSADGTGFEEWSVDADWFRVRRDTTWAFPTRDGQWCDVQCGVNDASNCRHRWRGDPGDYAATLYRDPGNPDLGAPWFPRRVSDGQTFVTNFRVDALRDNGCGACDTNYNGDTGHTVRVEKRPSWRGFDDVIAMHIVDGAGSDEVYYYARGQGWIGFQHEDGSNLEFATGPTADAAPADACGAGLSPGSICSALGGGGGGPVFHTLERSGCGRLDGGASLRPGEQVSSCSGAYQFAHQGDGNVVLYAGARALWATYTNGRTTETLAMQTDGNLVLYGPGGAVVWFSGTNGNPGAYLAAQDDGNAVIYSADGRALWATNTTLSAAPAPPSPPSSGSGGSGCAAARDCAACTALPTCGFCNGRCVDGTASGGAECTRAAGNWAWISGECGGSAPPPPPPPPPSSGCACRGGGIDNFCQYGPSAPGCPMTAPGGYCDPNGDGDFRDADWGRGWSEFQAQCH